MPRVPLELTIAQYELKCSYIARQLEEKEYIGLYDKMYAGLNAFGDTLDWTDLVSMGITQEAFDIVSKGAKKKHIGMYFCHPNILNNIKSSLKYYRGISVFSQKGLKTVSRFSAVERVEDGADIGAAQAVQVVRAVNRNVSTLYKSSLPGHDKLKALLFATAGITFDGSWKNQIGAEGERLIKDIIVRHAFQNGELASVTIGDVLRPVAKVDLKWIEDNAASFRSAMFTNGSTARFGSEPDVTLIDKKGSIVAGVEVKAGLDPAGALERLGAMLKSFDSILDDAPTADRILVVACVTDEVEQRLKTAKSVSRYYSLTDIMLNERDETRFANMIRGTLGLVTARH